MSAFSFSLGLVLLIHLGRNEILQKLPGDTSVMTYMGHNVRNTLIRCRFSPLETTGQVKLFSPTHTLTSFYLHSDISTQAVPWVVSLVGYSLLVLL